MDLGLWAKETKNITSKQNPPNNRILCSLQWLHLTDRLVDLYYYSRKKTRGNKESLKHRSGWELQLCPDVKQKLLCFQMYNSSVCAYKQNTSCYSTATKVTHLELKQKLSLRSVSSSTFHSTATVLGFVLGWLVVFLGYQRCPVYQRCHLW